MDYDSRVEVVLKQQEPNENDSDSGNEISLRELIEVLLRRKTMIIALTILTVGLALIFSITTDPYRNYQGVARVILQFNFDGIEKGLDPRGQRFDVGKIKSPAALDRVVEILDLHEVGITSSDLRNCFEITPVVPGNVVEITQKKLENLRLEDTSIYTGDDYMYYPNKYVVSFYIPEDIDLSRSQGERILREAVESYIRYFYDTYSDRATLSTAFQLINYEDYDYPEAAYIMRKQISIIQSYLRGKQQEAPGFRSKATGLSFGDIYEGTSVILDLDLTNLNSVIRTFQVTKDKQHLIATWGNRIKNYELEMAKLNSESSQARETMERYERERRVLLMGGAMEMFPEGLEMEEESTLYDELAVRALDTGVRAVNLEHEINYLRDEINFFLGVIDDEADEAPEISSTQRKEAEKTVIELMETTSQKLQNWTELTNETIDDYIANIYYDRAIMKLAPVQSSSIPISGLRLNLAIALILGLMLGVFGAFAREYWVNSGIAKENNNKSVSGN